MARVVFDGVSKVFADGTTAVSDLSLQVEDAEFMILVGPSGCGKSTALRMVAGLEEVTAGKLQIGERTVNDLAPKDRDVAMVFQSYALYPHMTVTENMGFALKMASESKEGIDRRVKEVAAILGLSEYLHRKPKALSGGQRQRVAMGRAIVRSPQAFLMDEPLSNLDAKLRVAMRAEIAALQNRLGVTTIYVTHDQVEAMTMGDRVAVLKLGVLQQVAPPQELYNRPANLFVAGFIGSPSMNIAEGRIVRDGAATFVELGRGADAVRLRIDERAFERYPDVPNHAGSTVAVGIRPEHFSWARDVPEDQRWPSCKVTLVEMLGAEMLVHFETSTVPVVSEDMRAAVDDDEMFEEMQRRAASGGQDFVARMEPDAPPAAGKMMEIGMRTQEIHFFDPETGRALR